MYKRTWLWIIVAMLSGVIQPVALANPAPASVAACRSCHGEEQNKDPRIPKLAGQFQPFIIKQINDYRLHRRHGHPTDLAPLSEQEIREIGTYYQQLAVRATRPPATQALGQALYLEGDASRGVKQCANCHGTDGMGRSPEIGMFPVVAGQNKAYIVQAMREYRDAQRKNDVSGMMTYASRKLSDDDIDAMADFLAGLGGKTNAMSQDAERANAKARPQIRPQSRLTKADESIIEPASISNNKQTVELQMVSFVPPPPTVVTPTAPSPSKNNAEPTTSEKPAKVTTKPSSPLNNEEKSRATRNKANDEVDLIAKQIFRDQQRSTMGAENGKRKAISCQVCHGKDGVSTKKHYPSLAGLSQDHLARQLHDYKTGRRSNPVMQEVTRTLTTADIDDIATYFATVRR